MRPGQFIHEVNGIAVASSAALIQSLAGQSKAIITIHEASPQTNVSTKSGSWITHPPSLLSTSTFNTVKGKRHVRLLADVNKSFGVRFSKKHLQISAVSPHGWRCGMRPGIYVHAAGEGPVHLMRWVSITSAGQLIKMLSGVSEAMLLVDDSPSVQDA